MNKLLPMHLPLRSARACACACACACALLATFAASPARAVDAYVGGGLGLANTNLDDDSIENRRFDEDEFGWKIFAGVRPIDLIGAELVYLDFGSPTRSIGPVRIDLDTQAIAAYGVLFLPIPVVDVYAKAGFARVETNLRTTDGLRLDRDETEFAWAVGAGLNLGNWALRAEYERFRIGDAKPDFLSLNLAWNFL